jgi:hypothetical protein
MSIDHGGAHLLVPEQLLHGPDVVAVLEQVRREGVSEGVAGRGLGETRQADERMYEDERRCRDAVRPGSAD